MLWLRKTQELWDANSPLMAHIATNDSNRLGRAIGSSRLKVGASLRQERLDMAPRTEYEVWDLTTLRDT